jgi:hypothetical protein
MRCELRRFGLTAAALVLALTVFGCGGAQDPLAHSCVATDQKFIATASVNVTAFNALADDFRAGAVDAEEIAEEAFSAADRIANVEPRDPSLRQAQKYLDAMFTEYGEAVTLHGKARTPASVCTARTASRTSPGTSWRKRNRHCSTLAATSHRCSSGRRRRRLH